MCGPDCNELGPPPDSILSMPPPPLPSFLLPRSAIVALSGNDSQPCFAAFMCEPSPGPSRENSGIEFIELSRKGHIGMEDTWILILVSSCIGILLLGALLAMLLMKCKDSLTYSYQETNIKQPPMDGIHERHIPGTLKANHNQYITNTMLPNSMPHSDNRMLWATLTPHGTRHFVADAFPISQQPPEDHYEVIDYNNRNLHEQLQQEEMLPQTVLPTKTHTIDRRSIKRTAIKSFDNSGFIDYEYEDPSPLIESYHADDMDSGYQEPHEIMGTLSRNSPRPLVSSPTRIENPNIPPLNMHPHRSMNGTLNKKATINRRISDASSAYGSSPSK